MWGREWKWDWDGDKIPVSGPYCHCGLATQAEMHMSLSRASRPGRRSAVRTTWIAALSALDRLWWPGRRASAWSILVGICVWVWVWGWVWVCVWDWDGDKIPVSGPYCHGGLATQAETHMSLSRAPRPGRRSAVRTTWFAALDRPSLPCRCSAVRTTWLAALDLPSWLDWRSTVRTTWSAATVRPSRRFVGWANPRGSVGTLQHGRTWPLPRPLLRAVLLGS